MGINDGSNGDFNDMDITLDIPHDLLITSDNNRLAAIVESMYPSILDNINEVYFSQTRAILVPNISLLI